MVPRLPLWQHRGVTFRIPAEVLVRRDKANGSSFPKVVGNAESYYSSHPFFILDINIMKKTEYKLLVKGVGSYTADSFIELIWIVFKHRCEHFLKGEGFRD